MTEERLLEIEARTTKGWISEPMQRELVAEVRRLQARVAELEKACRAIDEECAEDLVLTHPGPLFVLRQALEDNLAERLAVRDKIQRDAGKELNPP